MAPSVPLQGAVGVVPLLGAIVGCHCSVVWLGERVKTNFGGVGVPLLSAIAIVLCYGGGEEGVDVVPLQGAILECYGRVTTMYYYQSLFQMFLLFSGPPISPSHPRKRQ